MKKFILIFTLLLVSQVYALTLNDLICYENDSQIVNRRVNDVKYEFKLIEIISDTSGVFEVIRYDSLIDNREKDENKKTKVIVRDRWGNQTRIYSFNRERDRQRRYLIENRKRKEDIILEKDKKKTNSKYVYIENVDVKSSHIDSIFTFQGKHLYKLDTYRWHQEIIVGKNRPRKMTKITTINKLTLSKKKAEEFIKNNKVKKE